LQKIIICEEDTKTLSECAQALTNYQVIPTKTIKQCLRAYQVFTTKPSLLITAYELEDGTGEDIARALNRRALIKTIIMTSDLGAQMQELYTNQHVNEVLLKPFKESSLKRLNQIAARIIDQCDMCHGARLGTLRCYPCPFCHGSGHYNDQAFACLQYHPCDCPISARCEICKKACHCT
jgi:DNA-binding NtrC family response regulator